jgi:TgpA N-terminal domain/Transglutaminase-like superfamily
VTLNFRMTVTAAVTVVLTSTVLYPVFIHAVWFAASMGAVLVVSLIGAATRLRSLPVLVCLAAGVIGLLLYLNLVFEARHSLLMVIPTATSISRLWGEVGTGLRNARIYAPPVPNVPGLLFLTEAGVGITAVMTDLIAVRLRSTALAGLPLLVLFTVPVMVNAPHSQLGTVLVFCLAMAGYLAMLSADGRERIRVWGRLISVWRAGPPQGGASSNGASSNGASSNGASSNGASASAAGVSRVSEPGPGPDTRALAAAGRRVGLASVVLALFVPLLVPGLHPSKVFPAGPGIGGTGGSGLLSLPGALSQTVAELQEHRPSVVFTYTTSASASMESDNAQYFRQYALDTLDDSAGWQVANYDAGAEPVSLMPAPQGLLNTGEPQVVTTTVTAAQGFTAGTQPTFLPLVYPVTNVAVQGKWMADPELMVYSSDGSIAGQSYTEDSLDVDPTMTQLQQLGKLAATPGLRADLALPPSYETSALEKLAEKYVSGQTTEIGEVNALASWLSGTQFSYSLTGQVFDTANGLLSFLTKTRTGYCVQYAYAMTVLTRLLGIPARLAIGYTAGTQIKGSEYKVENTDAHAWPEVYFPTFGWLRFEPTPSGQGTAHATNYMGSASGTGQGSSTVPIIKATEGSGQQGSNQGHNQFPANHIQLGDTGAAGTVSGKSAGTPWAAIALAVIAAIALACGIIAMVAPPTQRAVSASAGRRRRPVSGTSVSLVIAAVVLIALALYRLLYRTSGIRLGAGWATVGIAFGLAAVVALTAPWVIRPVLRRWRWMRASDDVSRAHVAWREFRDDLTDFGVGCRASDPPRTLAGRVTAGLPEPAGDAIRRLALAEERANYAASPCGSGQLRHDASVARRSLAASAGPGARWRARIFPPSLMAALADAATRVPDSLAARLSRRRPQDRTAR